MFELCFLFFFFIVIFQLRESRKHLVYSFGERSLEDLTLNEWQQNCLCSPKINQQKFFRCFHCKLLCTFPHENAIKQAQIIYLRVFCFNLYPILFTIRVNSLNVSLHTKLRAVQRVPIDRQVGFSGWNEVEKEELEHIQSDLFGSCWVLNFPFFYFHRSPSILVVFHTTITISHEVDRRKSYSWRT